MKRIALVLVCVSSIAALASVVYSAPALVSKKNEFALPSISGRPYTPRISGDWVVTVRNVEKKADSVLLINVVTKDLYNIFNIANGASISPSIDGNLVAWPGKADQVDSLQGTLGRRGQLAQSMILFDLVTGGYTVPALKTNSAFWVSACGNRVAYELGSRIYLYETTTGAQRMISDDNPCYSVPDTCGDFAVWSSKHTGTEKRQVCSYQYSRGVQTEITSDDSVDRIAPKTDGRYIVWWTKSGVDVYDTTNGATFAIPRAFFPSVDRGIVVFQRGAEPGMNPVYGMNIATRQEFRISSGTATVGPDIDNGRVIWCSGETIYCAELSTKPGK